MGSVLYLVRSLCVDKRPDAVTLAQWSYYLAYASSGILLFGFFLLLLRSPLTAIVWLVLITSAMGTFMAWAARQEFKGKPGPEDSVAMAYSAFRINLGTLIGMLILVVLVIVAQVIIGATRDTGDVGPEALLWMLRVL
jgi:hypothetical protein